MSRPVKALILIVAAGLYAAVAWVAIAMVAVFNWIFVLGACDSDCGSGPDRATHIAAYIAAIIFLFGAVAGLRWLIGGEKPE